MKDNLLRTVAIVVLSTMLLILFVLYVVLPGLIRAMDQITADQCQAAFKATGYISDRCAEFIGR